MRIEQLTFTRFLAAIAIVIFHYGSGVELFFNNYTDFIFRQANLGVSYFFVLSGFVMIVAYIKRGKTSFIQYIKSRFARIYPVYFLALFLVLGVNLFRDIDKTDLFLNVTMIQSWVSEKALTLNYPGWSLSVELFFYLTFPFLLNRIYLKKDFKTIAILIFIFWFLSQLIFYLINNGFLVLTYYSIKDIKFFPLMHFNEFLMGNLGGLIFIKMKNNYNKNYNLYIFLTLVVLLVLLRFPFGLNYHNGLLAIIFIPLIILISKNTHKLTKIFTNNILVFLGEISFGIYILQAPVWRIFSNYRMDKYFGLNEETDFTLSFFIRLTILIILSSLSYLFYEKPLRRIVKNCNLKLK